MKKASWIFLGIVLLLTSACRGGNFPFFGINHTPSATLENTPTPQPTPTATPELAEITATVWKTDPMVPVITFHQFKPDGTPSDASGHKMNFGDLQTSLQGLYDSGFSLVSLSDWLSGNLSIPPGRRPLIITMDDLFFRNQILLDDSGQPGMDSGIGIIWQFSKDHPDFGFHLSLFAIMGDKYYPSDPHNDPDWEIKMARTIVWCIENDAMVYNHTYRHGYLSNVDHPVTMTEFIDQLRQNDEAVRYFLRLADRADLISRLGNIIALPGGAQPQSESDWEILQGYKNPEGIPVQAILGISSAITDPAMLEYLKSPYDMSFDKYRVPRLVATLFYLNYLDDHAGEFPQAQTCNLSVDKTRLDDNQFLAGQVGMMIESGACSRGWYYINGILLDARETPIQLILIRQ